MEGDFFAMGGYAFYVWFAYGLSAMVLIINAILPTKRERSLLGKIAKRTREKQKEQ